LVFNFSDNQTPQLLHSFDKMNIEYLAMLDNDEYYVMITGDKMVHCYSRNNLTQLLFQYNLKIKSKSKLFSLQTYHSNIIIFMFMNQFLFLQIKFDDGENLFKIQSEQILSIPNREVEYSLQFTPNKCFLILEQSLNLENNPELNDYHIFTCDNQFKISPIKEPITYIKSKLAASGKVTGFRTYIPSNTRSELWLAHQGTILHVRLPSNLAEPDIRSDYHCWLRHSLALYQQTTEKSGLSIAITSLALQSPNDSQIASGGDDGSIIIWHLTDKCTHDVLESTHTDEVKKIPKGKNVPEKMHDILLN
jgi:WD40 repeat protein